MQNIYRTELEKEDLKKNMDRRPASQASKYSSAIFINKKQPE